MHHRRTDSRRRRRPLRRGFSLIEVIVAVTIIAIFAAILAPNLLNRLGGAKQDKAQTEATAIASQVKLYLTTNRETSLGADFDLSQLVPEYLESEDDLIDPWGNRYVLQIPGSNGRDFDVVSYGADGAAGGDSGSENEDIVHGRDRSKKKKG
jgi:general secretion pathway protein G